MRWITIPPFIALDWRSIKNGRTGKSSARRRKGSPPISSTYFDLTPAYAEIRPLKIARASETRSTCPYCSVSCGVIIYAQGDGAKNVTPSVVHVEGDPDHLINRDTLCPKGSLLQQDILLGQAG